MTSYDAIIIGAGVVGTSIALSLSRHGLKTLNIDTLSAAGYGSTSNSSAIVRPMYSALEMCALAHESQFRWLEWTDYLSISESEPRAQYVPCGMLTLLGDQDQYTLTPSLATMRELGIEFGIVSLDVIEELFPSLSIDSFGPPKRRDDPDFGKPNAAALSHALYIPKAGYVTDPKLAAENLKTAASAQGASFLFGERVIHIDREASRIKGISTDKATNFSAPIVINAAGPHSSHINQMAGVLDDLTMPTRAMRHEIAHIPAPDTYAESENQPVVCDLDTGVYFRSETKTNILIGSLDPECDEADCVDPDDFNSSLTEQWTTQVWRTALRIPEVGIPNTAQGVVGLYDQTPDWTPIYDRSSLDGYYMAIGTSGNQFKNAPHIGDLMSTLILACENGQDHDATPVTYRLPTLDREIGLDFFSRRRTGRDGSGSVLV